MDSDQYVGMSIECHFSVIPHIYWGLVTLGAWYISTWQTYGQEVKVISNEVLGYLLLCVLILLVSVLVSLGLSISVPWFM